MWWFGRKKESKESNKEAKTKVISSILIPDDKASHLLLLNEYYINAPMHNDKLEEFLLDNYIISISDEHEKWLKEQPNNKYGLRIKDGHLYLVSV